MRKSLSLAAAPAPLPCGAVSAPRGAGAQAPPAGDAYGGRLRAFEGFVAAHRRAAAESCGAAYNIDPGPGRGLSAEEYVSGKLKAAAGRKKN